MNEFTVKFIPQNKTVRVAQGTNVMTAAIKSGIVLNAACGGEGLCGKCKVILKKGKVTNEATRLLTGSEKSKGFILACAAIVESDLEINVPKESASTHEKLSHNSEEFTKGVVLKREGAFGFEPLVRKIYLKLSKPTADDSTSDLERLSEALEGKIGSVNLSTKLANMKLLGDVLRESDFCVTVTVGHKDGAAEILSIEPQDTTKANFGFAFDIGTTTVVGQLIDLKTKEILGTRIAFNKQAGFGSDVITRIIYASTPVGLEKLNDAVLDNMNEMIAELTAAYKVSPADIHAIVCAGNMTMMHLLLKIDPTNIRKAPYIPTTTVFPTIHSSEVGLDTDPKGISAFLPGVSTYVGGDIVAGVLACGLSEDKNLSILIDIGTNGEIVLGNNEWMIGAAASAGPAFEGSGLSCGMKAVKGAIQKIRIDKDLSVKAETIGGDKPKGICGSGYIDLLCQMLKTGIIGKDGKIKKDSKTNRIRKTEIGYEFVVSFKKDNGIGADIVISEDDIENLKRSKGAIYSAIIALLKKVGKDIKEVKKFYIAGGFGNYLNIENSIQIGLLPDIDRNVYEFIGNSSLAGARMALLSHDALKKTADIYKNITYVDLGSEPDYMNEYVASLFFPHTDLERFPSVR